VEGTASLEIRRVDMNDAGNFTCRATNSVGSKDSSGALIVQGWLETAFCSHYRHCSN
jgi:titin